MSGAAEGSAGRSQRGGGRALGLGPRGTLLAGIVVALVLGGFIAALLAGGGGSRAVATRSPAERRAAKFGGLPKWLPRAKAQVGRTLHASAVHPALSIEGEAVSVELAAGRVLVTAVGPEVPEEGRFPVPPVTPVTFLVTFASASRPIALKASAFTLVDEDGRLHRPKVTALHGGRAPVQILPGHAATVELHDILPTGDGGVSWAPEGPRPIATWDYTVEID